MNTLPPNVTDKSEIAAEAGPPPALSSADAGSEAAKPAEDDAQPAEAAFEAGGELVARGKGAAVIAD
ncbi:MAG: hypothetical protein J0H21_05930, partial [Rhizobiales bacterium]|nr:hypothetical protein [Hyphomicrobiales bacterium]